MIICSFESIRLLIRMGNSTVIWLVLVMIEKTCVLPEEDWSLYYKCQNKKWVYVLPSFRGEANVDLCCMLQLLYGA